MVCPIVVTAAILIRDGRILVSQRRKEARRGLKWEFPGGKVEEGETPEAALERELREELGVETRTGRIYDAKLFEYPDQKVLVLFYFSGLLKGEPAPIDANAVEWVSPERLTDYDFAPADASVAAKLSGESLNLLP